MFKELKFNYNDLVGRNLSYIILFVYVVYFKEIFIIKIIKIKLKLVVLNLWNL